MHQSARILVNLQRGVPGPSLRKPCVIGRHLASQGDKLVQPNLHRSGPGQSLRNPPEFGPPLASHGEPMRIHAQLSESSPVPGPCLRIPPNLGNPWRVMANPSESARSANPCRGGPGRTCLAKSTRALATLGKPATQQEAPPTRCRPLGGAMQPRNLPRQPPAQQGGNSRVGLRPPTPQTSRH
jgi:hypothetical protein